MIYGKISAFVILQSFAHFREILALIISRKFCKMDSSKFCKKRTFLNFSRGNKILGNIFAFFGEIFKSIISWKFRYTDSSRRYLHFSRAIEMQKNAKFSAIKFSIFAENPILAEQEKVVNSLLHSFIWNIKKLFEAVNKLNSLFKIRFNFIFMKEITNRGRQFLITRFWKTLRETLTSTFKGPD